MSKTIVQVFNELPDEIKQEVYRIVSWSAEHDKIRPVIEQYESGQDGTNLYSSNDWCWFGKLTEEQMLCIAAIVKQSAVEKED